MVNFETLVEQQARYNRPELRIFFCGFEFTAEDFPQDLIHINLYNPTPTCIELIKKYLDKFIAKNQTNVKTFDFNAFADCFADRIPEELVRRLVKLRALTVNRPVRDADQLVKVLGITGPDLSNVEISSASLDQSFFDRLPKLCPFLGSLTIKQRTQLNVDFILDFKNLITLNFYQELSAALVKAALAKYEFLELLSFFYEDYRVRLNRSPDNKINLIIINEDGHYSLQERIGQRKSKARARSQLISELGLDLPK